MLPAGSVEEVRSALLEWAGRRDEIAGMRSRARDVWRGQFSAEARLVDWDALLDDVTEGRRR